MENFNFFWGGGSHWSTVEAVMAYYHSLVMYTTRATPTATFGGRFT